MRRGYFRVAGLLALVLAGCGGGDGGPDDTTSPSAKASVSGSVSNGGAGVPGAVLSLSGLSSASATTAASGSYSFANLSPGAYAVTLTVPTGLQLATGELASKAVTLSAGQSATLNFNLTAAAPATGSIIGNVRVGTTGVAGATIAASGTGFSQSVTSAAGGAYAFTGLAPGVYALTLTAPSGYTLAAGESGTKNATVVGGATATVNFGLAQPGTGSVREIAIAGFTFSPADVTITRGTTVRWTNGTGTNHTVTPNGHTEWADTDLPAGQKFEHTFNTAGTFNYYCTPHRDSGMTGVIRVQ